MLPGAGVTIYIVSTILFSLANVLLAVLCFRHRSRIGFYLGMTALSSTLVDLFYMGSALSRSYMLFSQLSSVYFICVDLTLINLWEFTTRLSKFSAARALKHASRMIYCYGAVDCLALLINPFREIAISYVPAANPLPYFSYSMHLLYRLHLVYTYSIVVMVVVLLIIRYNTVPREYRVQYMSALASIGIIVLINAVFLYIPMPNVISRLDLSVFGYTVGLFSLYYNSLNYSTKGMMDVFRSSIFENIMQGIVLFDYRDQLILSNSQAAALVPQDGLKTGLPVDDFLTMCNMDRRMLEGSGNTVQCYFNRGENAAQVRCDHRILYNDHSQKIGRLLVFTDTSAVSDILTGFHLWDHFHKVADSRQEAFSAPGMVAILDISGLTKINHSEGRGRGDQAIGELARLMRQYFPRQTYFVRGHDANLIAVSPGSTRQEIKDSIRRVIGSSSYRIIYSVSQVGSRNANVLSAISECLTGLQMKKLMDSNSAHSQMLTSLMQTLAECDHDTEAHVRRTMKLGRLLGKRLGLSDVEQSKLALLCMLHDIGKIGIPLEVLNKPGTLTDAEWATIQTHVEKGYQIAMSSGDISAIADCILHHHERWDGMGYPHRLAGEQIPLLSRIIAVVDAYDAMVNNRSYRKALTSEEALEELRRCAGSKFDPNVVEQFIRIIPMIAQSSPEGTSIQRDRSFLHSFEGMDEEKPARAVHPIGYCKYTIDNNMKIITVDDAFTAMTGYSRDDLRQKNMHQYDLLPPEDRTEYLTTVNRILSTAPSAFLEHRLRCSDGRTLRVCCYGKDYFDSVSRKDLTEIVCFDIDRPRSDESYPGKSASPVS